MANEIVAKLIEAGAHFEGSVQRQDDPLSAGRTALPAPEGDDTP